MSRPLRLLPFAAALALAGCAEAPAPVPVSGEPAMYRSLAAAGAQVGADSARSMISLYRANKGLGPLAVDAGLQRIAD